MAEKIGKSFSGNERDKLFFSRQGKEFKDLSGIAGLDSPSDGRVLSLWDYDRDGRQDFAVVNSNTPLLYLYRNEVPSPGGVIAVNFVGGNRSATADPRWTGRDGYGAKVRVKAGGLELLREYRCGEGMAAQNSTTMLIGLGAHERAESVTVSWPSGAQQEAREVAAGSLLTFYENPSEQPGGIVRGAYLRPSRPAPTARPELAKAPLFPTLKSVAPAGQGLRLYTTMATWCASCKGHLPQVQQLRESFDEKSLAMYGLPVDSTDDAAKLKAYKETFQPAYQMLSELSPAEQGKIKNLLGQVNAIEALPSTVVTDAGGKVLLSMQGLPTVSQLRALESAPVAGL